MLEKIKISISKSTYDILLKDCENFLFFKSSKALNKNLFLNTLIVNYYENFSSEEESFKEKLLKVINEHINENQLELLENIITTISKDESVELNKKTEIINLKPTKLSEKHILFIENNLIGNKSISSYYRNLFTSYARTPQNYRELILFKDVYETLVSSINKERKVCITLNNNEIINGVSVYKIESSKEELFNYVLINKDNFTMTLRLSKIKYVTLLNEKREITEKAQTMFERQIYYGVQYPFYRHNEESVIVKLSERGQSMFKKMYIYRPIPDKVEDNLYYFNCSHAQITHYFKRFGADAMIISPIDLVEKMKRYYFTAGKRYNQLLNKNYEKGTN